MHNAVKTLLVLVENRVSGPMRAHMIKEFFERQMNFLVPINCKELFYFLSVSKLHRIYLQNSGEGCKANYSLFADLEEPIIRHFSTADLIEGT